MQFFNNPPPQESEDCLYLNVYAPATPAPNEGRTVMFWLFGGGLVSGMAIPHRTLAWRLCTVGRQCW